MNPAAEATSTATASVVATPGANVTPGRIAALDGLRGIAVLMVVGLHYYAAVPGPPNVPLNDFLQSIGSLFFCGVDLFFVLSGFFIGGILLDHRTSRQLLSAFYFRRFFRIVPVYVLLLATFYACRHIPALAAIHGGAYFNSSVPEWSFFTFTQNILMAARRDPGPFWLGPTWSLAVEEQFYLLIPWVIIRFPAAQLMRIGLVLIALSPALRITALVHAHNPMAGVFLLPMHADGLLVGVICALLARKPAAMQLLARHRAILATGIAVGTVGLGLFSLGRFAPASPPLLTFGYSVLNLFFGSVLLYIVACPRATFARTLAFRPLAAIGVGSYFIYLFHAPIWFSLHGLLRNSPPLHLTWQAAAVTVLAFIATLGAAALSWRCLEAPLLRFARRFSYE